MAYDAMAKSNWLEARRLLLGLWANGQSSDVAASLGQVEFKLEHFGASARFMAFALANVPPSEKPEFVERLQAGMQELRPRVVGLNVLVSEPGAEVAIDEEPLGVAPLAPETFADPGKHVLTAKKDGRTARAEVDAPAGGSAEVRLELGAVTEPTPGASVTTEASGTRLDDVPLALDPAGTGARPSIVPVVIGGAIVLGAVVTSVALRVAAANDYDRADSLQRQHGSRGCSEGSALMASCDAQASANESGDEKIDLSTLGFALGGAALVATGAYWFWPRASAPAQAARVRLRAHAGHSAAFVGLSCDF